jgi:hypothetical protein
MELSYYAFVSALHHFKELAEHQIVQTGHNEVLVRVARQHGESLNRQELEKRLEESLRIEGLDGIVRLSLEVADTICPDPRSGKLKRVVNQFGPPPGLSTGTQ